MDDQGQKMSKSLGNVILPSDIINGTLAKKKGGGSNKAPNNKKKDDSSAYGADVLRLWVAASDYSHDLALGDTVVEKISNTVRKLRNTIRFALGCLYDFDPSSMRASFSCCLLSLLLVSGFGGRSCFYAALFAEHMVPYEQLSSLDKFTLHQLHNVPFVAVFPLCSSYPSIVHDSTLLSSMKLMKPTTSRKVLYPLLFFFL
jgi:isoleucyl-tRNA synthetase